MRYSRIENDYNNDRMKLTQYATEIERLTRESNMATAKLSELERLTRINTELQGQMVRFTNEKRAVDEEILAQQREWNIVNQRAASEIN
jgi:hypothetical protein